MILFTALYEFFLRISAISLPLRHGIAVTEFFAGITGLIIFFMKDVRRDFFKEVKKIKWAFLSEGIIFIMGYASLIVLPVAFVASVATIQPLAVLILEMGAHRHFGKISRDRDFKRKAIAISITIIGIILLYLSVPNL